MIALLLYIFLALLAFHISTRCNKRGRLLRKIPGPTPYPFVDEFWLQGRKVSENYYPITRFWFCKEAVISVRHPDDLEILLTSSKCIDKGYSYDYIQPWLKKGLLTSTGDKWRHRRKILTPAFHFTVLKKYLEITIEESKKSVETLKNEGKEIVKSLIPFSSQYTLNIICESAMGVSLDKMDKETVEEYKKAVHDMGNVVVYRMPRPYIKNWMMNYIWRIGSLQRNAVKFLHRFTDKIIQDRREYHKHIDNKYFTEFDCLEQNSSFNIEKGPRKRLAMLDLLLAAERNGLIDHNGIKEEVDTFTFEGHDTTSMAMTYTLMLLAENQEAQKLARTEVTQLYNEIEEDIEISHLQEMHYLERCIKESLRLYPPVSTIFRYTSEELQLKHALVPADSHLIVHLYDTHRDPNFWSEPDKFDPDRFLPERSQNRHPFAYVPFSAGPRNCIGRKFAMLELKSLISRILYHFYLEPIDAVSDIKLTADIVLRPLNPIRIKFIQIRE